MDNSPGWRIRTIIDPSASDALSERLTYAKLPHAIDKGAVTVSAPTREIADLTAKAIHQDFGQHLQAPTREMVNQGIQPQPRVWMQFSAGNDPRFEKFGTAGVPFLREDLQRLTDPNLPKQVEVDRAVMRSNDMLSHHYQRQFNDAPSHGWVVSIHAGKYSLAAHTDLTNAGYQSRITRGITYGPDGKDISSVIAYAGSMKDAKQIANHMAKTYDLHHVERGEFASRHQLGKGVEGHFIPSKGNELIIDHTRPYSHGLPRLHETKHDAHLSSSERHQRTAEIMRQTYGSYFSGASRDRIQETREPVKATAKAIAHTTPTRTRSQGMEL